MFAKNIVLLGGLTSLARATHGLLLPLPPNGACNRTELLAAADAYVTAQMAGKLDAIQALVAQNWTYIENNKELDPRKGILTKALKIEHRRTNTDMTVCATYTELISAKGPYVIGTQIRHDAAGKVASIDSVATTTNSWLFNAEKTLGYVQKEAWTEIPTEKRDSREWLKAVGDAWLDVFSNDTAMGLIPWGIPCNRLEGSVYTGRGLPTDSCSSGNGGGKFNSSQLPNIRRRYVIDESIGSVSIFCLWQHMMMAADSHEFRLENGKIRYVHTMTECGGRVCRL
jgi:hypothetical protein